MHRARESVGGGRDKGQPRGCRAGGRDVSAGAGCRIARTGASGSCLVTGQRLPVEGERRGEGDTGDTQREGPQAPKVRRAAGMTAWQARHRCTSQPYFDPALRSSTLPSPYKSATVPYLPTFTLLSAIVPYHTLLRRRASLLGAVRGELQRVTLPTS